MTAAKVKVAREPKRIGIIRADAREQNRAFLDLADERLLLRYNGPDGQAFSYDAEVVTKGGQVVRFECKWSASDCISTWLDRQDDGHSRLSRQGAAVDAILLVWDDMEVEMRTPKERMPAVKGLKNRLGRMALESAAGVGPAVVMFGSVADALNYLVYLKNRREPLALRPRTIAAGGLKEKAMEEVANVKDAACLDCCDALCEIYPEAKHCGNHSCCTEEGGAK